MRAKVGVWRLALWAATFIGATGLLVGVPEQAIGQAAPSPSTQQSAELAEAERLHQQVEQLYEQGQYAAAIPLAEHSLAIREKVLGPEHPDVAQSLNNLADLYQEQGNYSEAEPLYQHALAIREKVLRPEDPDVAQILNNLALLYQKQGNYSQAEPLYQRALAIREKVLGPEHPDVAQSLNNLALLYQEQGNYSQAEPLYQHALAIREKVLGPEDPDIANSLNNLAELYRNQGNYSQAEPLYQRSLAIFEKVLGLEHPYVATSLNNLAELYRNQGNYSQAEPLYQRSLAILEKVLQPEHPYVARSLSNLAELYRNQGNYSQAEPLLQRSLAIQEKVLQPEHPDVAISLNSLALLYREQGNYSQAEPLLQRSLAIQEKVLQPEHPYVATSLSNLAVLYQNQGDIARALEFQTRGTNIEERNLALIFTTGSEAQKRDYIATLSYRTNATISLHVQDAPNNPQASRLALITVLRRKGRVLDALTDSLQTLRQNLQPEDQASLDQLAATRSQLAALVFKGADNLPPDQYQQKVADLKAQANEQEATLARRSAQFRTQSQPVTLDAVQQSIPAEAALVELVLYEPFNPKATKPNETWGTPRYVAYILHSTGEPQWVDLGEAAPINQAASDFRQALLNRGRIAPAKQAARALDAILMQPIRQRLGDTRNILLSPDSQLNLIPFAALVDENNRYLIETYAISYLGSGRDLLRLQAPTASRQPPVLIADPDYDNPGDPTTAQIASARPTLTAQTNRSASTRSPSPANRRSSDFTSLQFGPLPGTAQEAKALTPLLPGVTLFTQSQATENALQQLHGPSILHIATHGFFLSDLEQVAPPPDSNTSSTLTTVVAPRPTAGNPENPLLRSGLALAGINLRQSGDQDGVLTALETASLDLWGTKLVVLSACETGLGDVANGEGVYGLRRALAIAGAETQLISLWQVDDTGTKDLMVSYYQRLLNNEGRSEALRQTQLELLQDPNYQHPYHWAAFIPSGNWTSLEAASPLPPVQNNSADTQSPKEYPVPTPEGDTRQPHR